MQRASRPRPATAKRAPRTPKATTRRRNENSRLARDENARKNTEPPRTGICSRRLSGQRRRVRAGRAAPAPGTRQTWPRRCLGRPLGGQVFFTKAHGACGSRVILSPNQTVRRLPFSVQRPEGPPEEPGWRALLTLGGPAHHISLTQTPSPSHRRRAPGARGHPGARGGRGSEHGTRPPLHFPTRLQTPPSGEACEDATRPVVSPGAASHRRARRQSSELGSGTTRPVRQGPGASSERRPSCRETGPQTGRPATGTSGPRPWSRTGEGSGQLELDAAGSEAAADAPDGPPR